jgi:hypothetical protein
MMNAGPAGASAKNRSGERVNTSINQAENSLFPTLLQLIVGREA